MQIICCRQKRAAYATLALLSVLSLIAPTSGQAQSALPDLALSRSRTANSLSIEKRNFPADDCAVIERCVRGPGLRTLLRFDVAVLNVGRGDLLLGDPKKNLHLYEWSPCHGHYHFRDLISYSIYNSRGQLVFRGAKQAFCLRDNYPYLRGAPASSGYNCDYQGLTRGWEDLYDKSLDCQWLDITGIKPGVYTMRATVNGNRRIKESSHRNNSFTVRVNIPRGRW